MRPGSTARCRTSSCRANGATTPCRSSRSPPPPGRATGLHTDPSHETFYILEGELLFHVDGEEYRAQAGETVAVHRGVPHAFLIVSESARFLVINTPGTQERFFRAGGERALSRDFADAPPPDLARTMAAADEYGVKFLGPPPFAGGSLETSG